MMVFAADFEPIAAIAAGGGPMNTTPLAAHARRTARSRTEIRSRVDRLRAGLLRDREIVFAVEIALARRRRAQPIRLVADLDVQRAGVGIRIDGDRPNAHPPRGARDAARDLSAIGDQDLVKHRDAASSPYRRSGRAGELPKSAG
jgi:hypothetical protein